MLDLSISARRVMTRFFLDADLNSVSPIHNECENLVSDWPRGGQRRRWHTNHLAKYMYYACLAILKVLDRNEEELDATRQYYGV